MMTLPEPPLLRPIERCAPLLMLCTMAIGCTIEGDPTPLRPAIDASPIDAASDASPIDAASDASPIDAPQPQDATGVDVQEAGSAIPEGSCESAVLIDVPAVSEAESVVLDLSGAHADLIGTCGGSLVERVIALRPSEDVSLMITVGGPDSFDPVLYVLAGACSTSSAQELACQAGPPGTQVMVQFEANQDHYIVVDTNTPTLSSTTVVTVLRLM